MTVNELTQSLEKFPPDAEVKVYDSYDGETRSIYGAGRMWQDKDGTLWHSQDDANADAELAESVAGHDERVVLPELNEVVAIELAAGY